ncbi:MAG: Hsp70 family protein [Pseudomonadales bacterium]|nr:Hsp70 family protein [Pseudomonadales bacterium]
MFSRFTKGRSSKNNADSSEKPQQAVEEKRTAERTATQVVTVKPDEYLVDGHQNKGDASKNKGDASKNKGDASKNKGDASQNGRDYSAAGKDGNVNKEAKAYAIGIDLGTTHCVLAYMPLEGGELKMLPIPQIKDPGIVSEFSQLPSFLYLPHQEEFNDSELRLPWGQQETNSLNKAISGEFARQHGSKSPIRLVSSAKSWLGHAGVDCKENFLPLDAPEGVEKISPFTATQHYLAHLTAAWEARFPESPIDQQLLTITVPASFDPLARELSIEAAHSIGLHNAVLLEEPQAALYGWLHKQGESWRKQLKVGDTILVVDVGGGTTDLSLIAVTENAGELTLERSAVGEHILLGGDNMDLTLAYIVKSKLEKEGKKIETWQLQGLTHGCRHAKENLLLDASLSCVPIVVPSRGSSLMGGSLRTELTREEVLNTLVEGFFPKVEVTAQPIKRRRAALTKKSLPFAQDPAISRHLAGFLSSQQLSSLSDGSFVRPTVLLFNGGVFKSEQLSSRLLDNLKQWLGAGNDGAESGTCQLKVLQDVDLDHAVASGAAYYSHVRNGNGVKIRGGTARSYYVGIESAMPAVPGFEPPMQAYCIAPYGMEEGSKADLPEEEFGLVVGEQACFRFYSSSHRKNDTVGQLLDDWQEGELDELEDISVNLSAEGKKPGEVVAVHLQAGVTEVGTLRLEAVSPESGKRWKVEFSVREEALVEA